MRSIKKNIVFLVPGFPKDENDINCIPIMQNYILYYTRLNPEVNVSVISFQYPFKKKKYRWHTIHVYAIGGGNKKGVFRIRTWLRVITTFTFLYLKNSGQTVIHSFWLTECAFIGQYIRKLFGLNHVSTIVGQDPLPSNKYLRYLNFSKLKIVALSVFAAEKFKLTTNRNADQVISIGLDTENFKTPPSAKPAIDILGVGNLHAIKNYSLFIEIVAQLVSSFPELKCVIIGNGEEYHLLQKSIEEHGLDKNVKLKGELKRNEVIELMADSRILLHPSVHEGQGYVFEEALYSGMYVVANKVGNVEPGEKIRVCESKDQMVEQLNLLLKSKPDRQRLLIQSMEDSVSKFNTLYFSQNRKDNQ
ncbi:MAG: glycosyltransferase family 4 protein [Bacteroidetes bacterium]|nr:glycosyltransferase family 4 protein [Bacteroidota bacterium]